jgi:S-adenosylmethionine synthetase
MAQKHTYLFTSESVSEGHPDKVADQISDAILDEFLRQDPASKVACETFCSTGMVVLMGEVSSEAWVDVQAVAREVIARIGYTKAEYKFDASSCGVLSAIHEQSPDIHRGVERADPEEQGAGDQGMMFGYACTDTEDYMPLPLYLSHVTLKALAAIRHGEPGLMPYLRPDAKCQYTIEYEAGTNRPIRVHTLVLSTQHDEFDTDEAMHEKIESDVRNILIPRVKTLLEPHVAALFGDSLKLLVNPTGKFVIGGPHGDTGLTGRKIIVDTYGGKGAHGGGAFSGKDPSKVDRSGAYAARYIAKNLVAAGVADEILVQVSYAIGVAEPVSFFVDTYGTSKVALSDSEIAEKVSGLFDLRPSAIIRKFHLTDPIYGPTAAYGHFGRTPYDEEVPVYRNGVKTLRKVRFFPWEDLDATEMIKAAFNL